MSGPASHGVSQDNVSPQHVNPPEIRPDHIHSPLLNPDHTHQQAPSDPDEASNADPFSQRVRQRFGRGAGHYDQEARLQQAMAWRLARLCSDLPLIAGARADLGAGTGLLSRAFQQHHPQLKRQPPLQLDLCPELLARNPLTGPCVPGQVQQGGTTEACAVLVGPPGTGDTTTERASGGRPTAPSPPGGLLWDLNDGLPEGLDNAALLASSFALQWLQEPARILNLWCRSLAPGGWLVLAVPTAGSFPQWRLAAERANVACTALALPDAEVLLQAAKVGGLSLRHSKRLQFSRPRQGGLHTLRHLQRLGASASRRSPLSPGELRRLLAHWPPASPLTWEVLLLIGQRRG